jgi:hypothetical protein
VSTGNQRVEAHLRRNVMVLSHVIDRQITAIEDCTTEGRFKLRIVSLPVYASQDKERGLL